MAEPLIKVDCSRRADGWQCNVTVRDSRGAAEYHVSVADDDLARFAPGAGDPRSLVLASFRFLLERESKESILRSFRLSEIERYFPEYETWARSRT